jgi:hypothetical protein
MAGQFDGKVAFITSASRGQGRPSIISEAMVYPCGASGQYITGIRLPIDAGYNVN